MSLDVACGELGFVDLTFVGLDALPGPGEERHGRALVRSPGGGATIAIACARLGLRSALASPIGDDEPGKLLRAALAADGVEWTGRRIGQTAVTVVMPVDGDRAMATVEPGEWAAPAELGAGEPRAVVVSLPRLDRAPAGARVYATAGDAEARAFARGDEHPGPDVPPAGGAPRPASHAAIRAALGSAAALIVNEREAALMTGMADAADAARALARLTPCAVVTRGAAGAVACGIGGLVTVPGVPADVVDTTGAGDLFTAAYVWADLAGEPLEERLRWATLYAARGVETATAVAGATGLRDLAEAGERLGLVVPRSPITSVLEEDRP